MSKFTLRKASNITKRVAQSMAQVLSLGLVVVGILESDPTMTILYFIASGVWQIVANQECDSDGDER